MAKKTDPKIKLASLPEAPLISAPARTPKPKSKPKPVAARRPSTIAAAAGQTKPLAKAAKKAPAAPPGNAISGSTSRKKPAARVRKGSGAPKRAPGKAIGVTTELIALRAYFISEKRLREGRHGDPHHDWIEAERQLKLEAAGGARKRNGS